jgi:ribose 5-phosphate isomerase A
LEEKMVAAAAKRFVIIADHRKQSEVLGGGAWTKGVPLEVAPLGYRSVLRRLGEMGLHGSLRMATQKAGPVVTDGGHFVIDVAIGLVETPRELDSKLQSIVGVLETGLFCGMATHAYFGQADGSVVEWTNPENSTPVLE